MINHLIKQAKTINTRPRVHANGFLQLDLSPTTRLHIWNHPDIPKQEPAIPVHDHTYSFTSLVLRGTMINQTYSVDYQTQSPTHRVFYAKEQGVLEQTVHLVKLFPLGTQEVRAGYHYTLSEDTVHESITRELTITVILKTGPSLMQGGPSPHLFAPLDVKPTSHFDRYSIAPVDLWKIITEVMK